MGSLLAVYIHAANIHDSKSGLFVLQKTLYCYPNIQACCADAGYRGKFKNTFEDLYNIRVDISKQIKPKFEIFSKCWRVERTFAWMGNFRRLLKDFERRTVYAETMVMISYIYLLLKRF